jgi:CMP/dCMP kinase
MPLNDMPEQVSTPNIEPGKSLLITIDGPAGSGKTTVSRLLAKQLDYQYVDTGALYRCIAYAVIQAGISATDNRQLNIFVPGISIYFKKVGGQSRIFCNDEDISDKIRTPEVTMLASDVSAMPAVRQHLLDVQREMGQKKSVVFEGRDMGTVVFPEADIKFFLDAAVTVRAQRRHRELTGSKTQTLKEVQADIQKRDHNDSHRELAPLKAAEDAILIDTTDLSIEAVVNVMLDHIVTSFGVGRV